MLAVVASVVYAPGLGLGHFVLNDKDGACCMRHAVCGMWQVLACSTFYDYVMRLRKAKHSNSCSRQWNVQAELIKTHTPLPLSLSRRPSKCGTSCRRSRRRPTARTTTSRP